jgi:hypothetical protein
LVREGAGPTRQGRVPCSSPGTPVDIRPRNVFLESWSSRPFQPCQEAFQSKDFSFGEGAASAVPTDGALVSTVTRTCCFNHAGPCPDGDSLLVGDCVAVPEASAAGRRRGGHAWAKAAKNRAAPSRRAGLVLDGMPWLKLTSWKAGSEDPVCFSRSRRPQHLRSPFFGTAHRGQYRSGRAWRR